MPTVPTPVEVFCCYAREDEAWLRKLEIHLSLLKRQGLVSLWHDRLLVPGTDWAQAIDTSLETASIILLLVSADFLTSDYCYGVEMKRALARQETGEVQVIPILLRPADWDTAPFAHLHPLPTNAKPISTWSNQDAALADVAASIRHMFEKLPLLAVGEPQKTLPLIWNIPYPRNPFFLGRDAKLVLLHSHLQAGQATALSQPQIISGLGGIGKTQLALEYAYRFHQSYQAVLWARAESTEALISSFVSIASFLRFPESEAKEQEVIVQAVRHWLQTHRDWLLILDNADELALLADFLPSAPSGHLLLTTRATATGRLARRLEIETWQPEQGALFLLRRAGLLEPDAELAQASQEERELAERLSQDLGGLPLALDQAGAYLEETGTDLASYWGIYHQHRANLLRERRGLVMDHPASVASTWSISFQRVAERSPAAAELLRACAYLAPEAIAEEILMQGASELGPVLSSIAGDAFHFNQAIEVLRSYSLVRRESKEKTLSIHRLVQAVLQDTQEQEEQRLWAKRAVLAINAVFPHVDYGKWPECERLLAQVLGAAERIEQYHITTPKAGRLLYEAASYLQKRARYAEAELLYQRSLYVWEQQLGSEHPNIAFSLNNLADLYSEQDKYAEAEPLYQRALYIREQQLGPNHYLVATPLNNLAILYSKQGKYAEAEPLYQRALHIEEQRVGPDQAHPLNNLAILYSKQGKYVEAELLYQRSLHIWEQQLGSEHPNVAAPLSNLAELYSEQGKYAEAEPLFQRALHICEQQFGPDHPKMATPLNGLASLYSQQGKYAEAEPLFQQALHICEQRLGLEHPETAEIIHELAAFQEAQGHQQKALSLYQRALVIREHALGSQHPKTQDTQQRLIALSQTLEQDDIAPFPEHSHSEQEEQTM